MRLRTRARGAPAAGTAPVGRDTTSRGRVRRRCEQTFRGLVRRMSDDAKCFCLTRAHGKKTCAREEAGPWRGLGD
jgi:hypothetical protein